MRRYKDLQLRANWIPGGHLRFQVLNSSAKCRSLTSQKQKFLSKNALAEQLVSCKNLENQNSLVQSDKHQVLPFFGLQLI